MSDPEIDFLKRHPDYAFHAISSYYPLTAEILAKYRDVLFWSDICENYSIEWSTGIVQTFLKYFKDEKGKLNFGLHYNNKLPWSVEFIKHFEKHWHWDILGQNMRIQNDLSIQQEFNKYLEPVNAWIAITNEHYSHDKNCIVNTTDEQKGLALEEIAKRVDEINWKELSGGYLPLVNNWNIDFLKTYEQHIDFDTLSINSKAWADCFGILENEDVEAILSDKDVEAKVARTGSDIYKDLRKVEREIEESHSIDPRKCLTFKFFILNVWNKSISKNVNKIYCQDCKMRDSYVAFQLHQNKSHTQVL